MQIRDLIPWGRGRKEAVAPPAVPATGDESPMLGLHRDINRVFDDFWTRFDLGPLSLRSSGGGRVGDPRTDIVDTDKAVEVSVELPGLDEKDIEITVSDDVLTIRGEKTTERENSGKGYYLHERSYGSFYRAIPLPADVVADGATAEYRKGVLTVTLPKSPEAQAQGRKIEVKSG